MITLQADPLIQWDETITTLIGQSQDAQDFVNENILSTVPVSTNETVHSVVKDVDWDRIKSQLYTWEGFTLNVARTYFGVEDRAVQSCVFTLAVI